MTNAKDYDFLLKMSILRSLRWLTEKVLINRGKANNLRKKLRYFSFDEKMNAYLIERYNYWKDRLAQLSDFSRDDENHMIVSFPVVHGSTINHVSIDMSGLIYDMV